MATIRLKYTFHFKLKFFKIYDNPFKLETYSSRNVSPTYRTL